MPAKYISSKILFFFIVLSFIVSCTNKQFQLISKEEKQQFLSTKTVFDIRYLKEKSAGTITEASTDPNSGTIGVDIFQDMGPTGGNVGGVPGMNPSGGDFNDDDDLDIPPNDNASRPGTIGIGAIVDDDTNSGNGTAGSSPNVVVNPNPAGAIATDTNSIPVKFICSTQSTNNNNGNIKTTVSPLTLTFTDQGTGKVLCSLTDAQIKDTILNEKRLLIPESCPTFAPNSTIKVTLAEKPDKFQNFIYSSDATINKVKFTGNNEFGKWTLAENLGTKAIAVLLDMNDSSPEDQIKGDPCDERISADPLFVDLGTNETLSLSPPSKGIFFDILGRNSFPKPYTKKQVSWFSNKNFMFLVNPSASNKVEGIDQMFGDNTYGPDGQFSIDGFRTLAKYDSNHDGVIDAQDKIFAKLRLWSDTNSDGIAEPGELFYLDFMNITAIDLAYDKNYYEKDIYGNEIKYKSIVQLKDGSVKLMFDLWFRYL